MKTLTIKQPYATLIAEGLKKYEFRTWKTNYRGKILIHAGKGIDKKSLERCKCLNLDYKTGYIIAIAEIKNCIEVDKKMIEELKRENEIVYYGMIHSFDNNKKYYAYKLENIRKIKPIKASGKLSFWNYDYKEVI